MPTANYILGRECTLSISGFELTLAKEVTVELSTAEADVTCRASEGVKRIVQAHRELTVSGTAVYSPDDPAIYELFAAHAAGRPVLATISDPSFTYTGAWTVKGLPQQQALEEAAGIDFTLVPIEGATQNITIAATQNSGMLCSEADTWSLARSGNAICATAPGEIPAQVAANQSSPRFQIWRGFLQFDTSGLGGRHVVQATLGLCAKAVAHSGETLRLEGLRDDFGTLGASDWGAAARDLAVDRILAEHGDPYWISVAIPPSWIETSAKTALRTRELAHDALDVEPTGAAGPLFYDPEDIAYYPRLILKVL